MDIAEIKPSTASEGHLEVESIFAVPMAPLMSLWKENSSSFVSLAEAMPPIASGDIEPVFSFM